MIKIVLNKNPWPLSRGDSGREWAITLGTGKDRWFATAKSKEEILEIISERMDRE